VLRQLKGGLRQLKGGLSQLKGGLGQLTGGLRLLGMTPLSCIACKGAWKEIGLEET